MKRLIYLFLFIMGFTLMAYSQSTPTFQIRVANATTTFNINVPVGATVWDVGANKYYGCKTATASTLTLTTGSANFQIIGGSGVGTGTVTDIAAGLGISTGGSDITTTGTVAVDTANASILSRQRAANTYQPKGTYGAGTVTSIATGLGLSGGTITGSGTLIVDTANASILSRQRAVATYLAKTLTSGNILVGSAGGVAASVTMSNDATISNTGAVTIAAGAVTLAKQANLAANSIIGNNTGSSATPIAMTTAQTRTLLQVTQIMESFEAAHDSTTEYIVTLAHTPQALSTMTVILNGLPLKATTQVTWGNATKITILLPVYTYDKISVGYQY